MSKDIDVVFGVAVPAARMCMTMKNPRYASSTELSITARFKVFAPTPCCLSWLALDYAGWLLIHSATYLEAR